MLYTYRIFKGHLLPHNRGCVSGFPIIPRLMETTVKRRSKFFYAAGQYKPPEDNMPGFSLLNSDSVSRAFHHATASEYILKYTRLKPPVPGVRFCHASMYAPGQDALGRPLK